MAQSASVTQHIAFETVHTGPVRGTGLSPATCGRHMSANTVKGDKLNEYDRMAVVRNHKDNNREMDECDCAERRNQKDTP